MREWRVISYADIHGKSYVEEFIDGRSDREQQKILALIGMLAMKGPLTPRPYADVLRDGIHELRVQLSGEKERIFYFFAFRDYIVLTHVFRKNVLKIPDAEIEFAKKCRSDFSARYSNSDKLEAAIKKGKCQCLNA